MRSRCRSKDASMCASRRSDPVTGLPPENYRRGASSVRRQFPTVLPTMHGRIAQDVNSMCDRAPRRPKRLAGVQGGNSRRGNECTTVANRSMGRGRRDRNGPTRRVYDAPRNLRRALELHRTSPRSPSGTGRATARGAPSIRMRWPWRRFGRFSRVSYRPSGISRSDAVWDIPQR